MKGLLSGNCQAKRKEPQNHIKDEVKALLSRMRRAVVIKNLPMISEKEIKIEDCGCKAY